MNVALILMVFAEISGSEELMNVFFNSDTLYLPSIYYDIFRDGGAIKDWELNPAPNFFPDMPLYFILMAILKDFILASVVFAILQYLFVFGLMGAIFRLLFPVHSNTYYLLINTLLTFFLLETLFFTKDFYYTFIILSNAYHMGSFVLALSCFYLTLKYTFKPKIGQLILLFLLQFLGVLSDKLFIITFIAPLIATTLLLSKSLKIKLTLVYASISILALISGLFTFYWLIESKTLSICTPPLVKETNTILLSWHTFIELMTHFAVHFGFKQIILSLFLVTSVLNLVFCFQQRSKPLSPFKFYQFFVLFFTMIVLFAPILSGNFLTGDQIRYNLYPFCLFPLHIAVLLAHWQNANPIKSYTKYAVALIGPLILLVGFIQFKPKSLNSFMHYYPPTVRLIDSIAHTQKLGYGIADYWNAKKITMFSKEGLLVYHVDGAVALYPHVANINWYYKPDTFNFILMNGISDTTFITNRLVPKYFIHYQPNFKLLRVSPFVFRKNEGIHPINL